MEVATVTEILRAADRPDGDARFEASGRLWYAANRLLTEAAKNFSRRELREEKSVGEVTRFEDFLGRWQRTREGAPADLAGLTKRYQEARERWLGPLQAVALSQGAEQMITAQLQRAEAAAAPPAPTVDR